MEERIRERVYGAQPSIQSIQTQKAFEVERAENMLPPPQGVPPGNNRPLPKF